MRTGTRRVLGTGFVAALAYGAWRAWRARVPEPARDISWETAPFPFPPVPRPTATPPPPKPASTEPASSEPTSTAPEAGEPASVEPAADGTCPPTHPVKAKLASGIYHLPGGANYDRTKPDRCYVSAAAAEADGLRAAKR